MRLTAPPDWTALARYLDGEASPEEASTIRDWLNQNPSRLQLVTRLDQATRIASSDPALAPNAEAALRKVKSRFQEAEVIELPLHRRGWLLRIAAALTVIVGGALLWRLVSRPTPLPDAATYWTTIGQTDSLDLADGTRVILAPASRLIVQPGYGMPQRTVVLEGQAFFDVPHDPARPFLIRAGSVEIRDLGTRFTVRADEEGIRVVVESGSVELSDTLPRSARRVTLKAGEAVTLGSRQAAPQAERPREGDLAWLRGQLIFDNAPLARVRDDLRRWYGIELVWPDSSLASRHVSARFAGESPAQVLRVLELALGASIERRGDTAIVRPGRPRGHPDR